METFKDFIDKRFGINEDIGYQNPVSDPNVENIDYDLLRIFKYLFKNYRKDTIAFVEQMNKNKNDDNLRNDWENLKSKVQLAGIVDNPLGNIEGSTNKTPELYPNQQSDSSSHFGN